MASASMDSSVRASMDFNGPLNTLSMSPSNKYIAVGGRDGMMVLLGPRIVSLAGGRLPPALWHLTGN